MVEKITAFFGNYALWFLAAACLAAGFGAGWTINGWRWEARSNGREAAHEEALNAAQKAVIEAFERTRAAEARGAALAQDQLALEAANLKLAKEKENALRKVTTGRVCFGDAALRLLNDTGSAGHSGLPPPAGGAVGPAAAAPSGSGDASPDEYAASDTDVAIWAIHARGEYDRCRGRIDALRSFYANDETP